MKERLSKRWRRRKCKYCRDWYEPEPHNVFHQKYCSKPECRKASKRRSYLRWRRKNPNHFRKRQNTLRVKLWREAHPDYPKHKKPRHHLLIEVTLPVKPDKKSRICVKTEHRKSGALQVFTFPQGIGKERVRACLACVLQVLVNLINECVYLWRHESGNVSLSKANACRKCEIATTLKRKRGEERCQKRRDTSQRPRKTRKRKVRKRHRKRASSKK